MCLQSASVGVPNSKLACFRRGEFRDSLQMQLHDGKQQDGETRMMDMSYLVSMVSIQPQKQKERNYYLLIHSLILFLLSNKSFELNGTMSRAEQRVVRKP